MDAAIVTEFDDANEARPDAPEMRLEKARHLMTIGRYDLVEREMRGALTADPDNAYALALLAYALWRRNKFGEAETEARAALEKNPQEDLALVVLGGLLASRGRHREAEEMYLQALQLDPTEPYAYIRYASLMHKTGYFKKSEKLVRQALKFDPDNADAHAMLGTLLSLNNDSPAKARFHGRQGLELDPDDPDMHYQLAVTYYNTGRPFTSRYHAREALRMEPDFDNEEIYLKADKACRWIYLPFYYFSMLVKRMPGAQFTLWAIFVVFLLGGEDMGVPTHAHTFIVNAYIGFAIYTWFAEVLATGWIRLRPPK